MRIFFAGPLTNLVDPVTTKNFYTKMSVVAKNTGFDSFWAFKSGTDPVKDPGVDPEYIYYKDLSELEESNLMIAYIGEPSAGTGQELEYAREHNIPIILVYPKSQHVSRMVIGNPAVIDTIAYDSEEGALEKLQDILKKIKLRMSGATDGSITASTDSGHTI